MQLCENKSTFKHQILPSKCALRGLKKAENNANNQPHNQQVMPLISRLEKT